MARAAVKKIVKDDSFEDFEFFDADSDMDIDMPSSPTQETAEKFSSGLSLIFSALAAVIEDQGLVVAVPVKAMAATAVSALTGSLLGGPSGLAIGLITGAVIAYRTSPGHSKSPKKEPTASTIRDVFSKMTLQQKKELLKELLGCLKQSNVRSLIVEILKNEEIRKIATNILSSFLMKKMGLSLTRPKL